MNVRTYWPLFRTVLKVILVVVVITLILNYDRSDSWEEILVNLLFNGLMTTLLWLANGFVANRVTISWLRYPVRRFILSFILTVIVTLAIAAGMWLLLDLYCCRRPPLVALQEAGMGYYLIVLVITFLISLFLHGRDFLKQWKESIVETEQLKQAHLVSRYESLKSQVNPHFLFNSFNVLSNLVHKDADLAEQFIKQLAEVYRYVLQTREQEAVTLSTELKALEAYLFLLHIRFGESLQVEMAVKATEDWMVAPLAVQMLVENAVKHNVVSKSRPLRIRIETSDNFLMVSNKLQRKTHIDDSVGVGLANIRDRYRYLAGRAIEVREEADLFTVSLPKIVAKTISI